MKLNQIADNPGARKSACASAAASARARARPAAAAARARRPAPASRSRASKAARCRSIGGCRSAASTTPSRVDYNEVNLGRIQAAIDAGKLDAGEPVDAEALVAAGVIAPRLDGVRLLGNGELKTKVDVRGVPRLEGGSRGDREGGRHASSSRSRRSGGRIGRLRRAKLGRRKPAAGSGDAGRMSRARGA